MKYLNSKEISKMIKRNYIYLIISILLLLATILLIYIGYKEQKLTNAIPMNNLSGNLDKLKNKNAYIDIAMTPYLFATYKTNDKEDNQKFYLAMDKDNFLYIVYMDNDTFNRIKDIKDKEFRIMGVTEEITDDIKELAITAYNKELGEEYLNNDNFQEFVGPVLLNTTIINDNSLIYYIISIITCCIFIIFITYFLSLYIKNKKTLKQYTKEELEKIGMQIYGLGPNPYKDLKLYLTKEYLIDYSQGLTILKYNDIIMAYPNEYRYNGLLLNKNIRAIDKSNHKYDFANTKLIKNNKEKIIEEILTKLKQKNKNIILENNKENKKIVKEIVKNNQNKQKKAK